MEHTTTDAPTSTWIHDAIRDAEDYLRERFGTPLPLDVSTCLDIDRAQLLEMQPRLLERGALLLAEGYSLADLRKSLCLEFLLVVMGGMELLLGRLDRVPSEAPQGVLAEKGEVTA